MFQAHLLALGNGPVSPLAGLKVEFVRSKFLPKINDRYSLSSLFGGAFRRLGRLHPIFIGELSERLRVTECPRSILVNSCESNMN